MLNDFILGIRHFFLAFGFIFSNRLSHYYLYPLAALIILYSGLLTTLAMFSKDFIIAIFGSKIPEHLPEIEGLGSFLNFLGHISLYSVGAVLFSLMVLLLTGKFAKYIVLMLLSPVFAYLSERTEEIVSGKTYPFNLWQFLSDIVRGIVVAIRNLVKELLWMFSIYALGLFFPLVSIIATPALVIVSAYFYGFSMIDYVNERRRLPIMDSVRHIRNRKGFAIGNGLMYWLFDLIPFLGLLIAPINGVVGAVTGLEEMER